MILFIAVQYNDPDGIFWMALYSIPAAWTAVAAFKSSILWKPAISILLLLCMMASCIGLYWFWPDTPSWWRQEVWWETETAREGMGMMVIAIVLVIVWFSRPAGKPKVIDT